MLLAWLTPKYLNLVAPGQVPLGGAGGTVGPVATPGMHWE